MELNKIIQYYTFSYEKVCKFYKGDIGCEREEKGCYCRKMAEISGLIYNIIPPEYRDFNINKLSGWVKTKGGSDRVWSETKLVEIVQSLSDYMYGTKFCSDFTTREDFNRASKLDLRYAQGANLVIHGNPFKNVKSGKTINMPTGKTLLACVVIIDAIWRRFYAANKADTYAIASYQTLKQDIKLKTDKAYNLKECDWLVIDDISLPQNENDFNHQNFVTMFDDFLMTRMENRLPTLLLCEFDALSRDYTDTLGYSFQKMISASNTWQIKVGE